MNSKKIFLVRHGQTDFNFQGIVQGSGVDSSLNAYGKAQGKAFFEAYKHVPFDKVYTSALKRSQESVEGFIQMGIPHVILSGLNEIGWGSKEGQKITPEEDEYYHQMLRQWQEGNVSARIEGGESPLDVVERLKPAVKQILEEKDDQTILICMHGRAMRILLCYLLHYPLQNMDFFEHQNFGLYKLSFTGTMFRVDAYNDIHHLDFLN